MEAITQYLIQSTVSKSDVRVWEEDILLPTYGIGKEEKNPIFLEKRVYQGSSGAVYPYPVIEKISDEKKEKKYHALFLENEYLKIMILPELGGRVQMAYDKVKGRHFVYYNQVIKPALVGLTGPWISGGIEFNWPQHHRPSTFLPTDFTIEENADGSKTVWCNEIERMSRTKGMQGFTLSPGKAYLEIKVKIYNRTPFPQTFLWWANPAVKVGDHYHSVFPPDVHAVYDHGKRDVSSFPIATGIYYKQDYSAGIDISKYKNIPVPTSYMAVKSDYDFVGGYEEDTHGGLLHVADHHISPGKKQWTWGNGDFGRAWDRNLTDEDGPYIELMTGVYTDNQPDFSWIQPYEERSWKQYFMPYSEVGYVKNATKDFLLNLEAHDGKAVLKLYATGVNSDIQVLVKGPDGILLLDERTDISPSRPYDKAFTTGNLHDYEMASEIRDRDGNLLLRYQACMPGITPVPKPAEAAKDPRDISSIEQLFLTGLHLEQYRHATYNPLDYYMEALRREPRDVRCNNAVGLYLLRRGKFEQAESYFRKSIETLTLRNPNPYDGEPYYNLGCCLVMQCKCEAAYDAYYKATWNAAWQDSSWYALAQLDCRKRDYEAALDKVERSLLRNWHNHKARQLKSSILRKLERKAEALAFIGESLAIDRFNMGCRFEEFLLTGDHGHLDEMKRFMRGNEHGYIEYALDFAASGLYVEAMSLLEYYLDDTKDVYPMVYYAIGYFHTCMGDRQTALQYYLKAEQGDFSYCFPNRIEEVPILQDAIRLNGKASKAAYSLGNYWYANRQYDDAIACWESSSLIDPAFPTVWRNLALAFYNKRGDKERARECLERAYALDEHDGRVLMELDQLYKRLGYFHRERLSFLEQHLHEVEERDDLSVERITLYNQLGAYVKAKELLAMRKFHPWEGGEGKVTGQYLLCHVELAKIALRERRYADSLSLLEQTAAFPHNLGEGKLINAEENNILYYKGEAFRGLGKDEEAIDCFQKATIGSSEPQQAFFYNDPQPDNIFYQGLAWRALGEEDKARSCFHKLIRHGEKHLFDRCRIDYFAVSLPDLAIWEEDLDKRNLIHCNYVMGLGYLGLQETNKAIVFLDKVRDLDINHQGGQIHRNLCNDGE
ncbi:MAG: DUF5107 domain-containing protein [Prevotella sp.]|nr:DUF5107 domain-containing protein [Prevotella sp.]